MKGRKEITFSLFTKPWRVPILELGKLASELGFDAIELPVRPGFQVEPQNVVRDLPKVAEKLADFGLVISSVAGPTDEATITACGEAGVPIIRICVGIEDGGYMTTEAKVQKEFEALVPLLDKHMVRIGVQNHCDRFVANAMGIRHLIEKYDPRHIGAVWDVAHNALNGEDPEMAVDILWSHLCMVNLKNAFWQRTNGPEAEYATWSHYWTTGRHGMASWPRVASELKKRKYRGVVCLTAEYNDERRVDRLIAEDIAFARSLFD